jgi:hypothetical protein
MLLYNQYYLDDVNELHNYIKPDQIRDQRLKMEADNSNYTYGVGLQYRVAG